MSLLRTAQASPGRKRSGNVSPSLRSKFESASVGLSSSFRSKLVFDGSALTDDGDTIESGGVGHTRAGSIASEGDQSISSYRRTLSGSSGSSSFSVSKAFNAVKKKMNSQRAGNVNFETPPLLEVKTSSSSGTNAKKVSLGGNLQMDFNLSVPLDRVHVQSGQTPAPSPPKKVSEKKAKNEAYAKAAKMLAKLDEQQKVKMARAKETKIRNAKLADHDTRNIKKRSKVKVVTVTQISEDTSTIGNSQPSAIETTDSAVKINQKQRLLERLEKMGLKTFEPLPKVTPPSSVQASSIQSSIYTSHAAKDPDGPNASSHGLKDPSGFVISYNPDDAASGSGSSSRSNEENNDPTSPRSERTPKSTNLTATRTMTFAESETGSHSSVMATPWSHSDGQVVENSYFEQTDLLQNSFASGDEDSQHRNPADNLDDDPIGKSSFDSRDEDHGQSLYGSQRDGANLYSNSSTIFEPLDDGGASDIALQMLSRAQSSKESYRFSDNRKQRVETITSFDLSVHVVSDSGGEDFEAIHVDETNPFEEDGLEFQSWGEEHVYPSRDLGNSQSIDDYDAHQFFGRDQGATCSDDEEENAPYKSRHDRYAIEYTESGDERLSVMNQRESDQSNMDNAFGMEDIFNMALSRLGGSTTARDTTSTFSVDSVSGFAAGTLSGTPTGSVNVVPSDDASGSYKIRHADEDTLRPDAATSEWMQAPRARTYAPQNPSSILQTVPLTEAIYSTTKTSETPINYLESNSYSSNFSIEADEEEVLIQIETDDSEEMKSPQDEALQRPASPPWNRNSSPDQELTVSPRAGISPIPESPRRTYLPPRTMLKETIASPPSRAFDHPIPIQMSPARSLFDDLSNSMAPSSLSDGTSVLTKEKTLGIEATDSELAHEKVDYGTFDQNYDTSKALGHNVEPEASQFSPKVTESSSLLKDEQSPSTVDQFSLVAATDVVTPPSSPTVDSFKIGSARYQTGKEGPDSHLDDDDDYWDTLSTIGTESVIRSQKNFEELNQDMGTEMRPPISVSAASLEAEGAGCICPWNEHVRLPKDHPDYKGPPPKDNNIDIFVNDSTETFDENIPFEISYLPDVSALQNLQKDPHQSMAESEHAGGSLGNLRSILTASSSSSSSRSSFVNSVSFDNDSTPAGILPKNHKVEDGRSDLKEAIKRGEDQAFVDSPKVLEHENAFADSLQPLAEETDPKRDDNYDPSQPGPLFLPLLSDTETRFNQLTLTVEIGNANNDVESVDQQQQSDVHAGLDQMNSLSQVEGTMNDESEWDSNGDGHDASFQTGPPSLPLLVDTEFHLNQSMVSVEVEQCDHNILLASMTVESAEQHEENDHLGLNQLDSGFGSQVDGCMEDIRRQELCVDDTGEDPRRIEDDESFQIGPSSFPLLLGTISQFNQSMSEGGVDRRDNQSQEGSTCVGSVEEQGEAQSTDVELDEFKSNSASHFKLETSDFRRGMISVDDSEADRIETPVAFDLDTNNNDDYIFSDDDDDNSENTNALLLALSRSNDQTDRNDPYQTRKASFDDSTRNSASGSINLYLEATTSQLVAPDMSTAAVGGSPKRRKMKEYLGNDFTRKSSETHDSESEGDTVPQSKAGSISQPLTGPERALSPTKQLPPSPEVCASLKTFELDPKTERPHSPTKQSPPSPDAHNSRAVGSRWPTSPELNISPMDLLMEEAEIILSKGLRNRPKPRETDMPESFVKEHKVSMHTSGDSPPATPTKSKQVALVRMVTPSYLCATEDVDDDSDVLPYAINTLRHSEQQPQGVSNNDSRSSDPSGGVSRFPSPEKVRFPSPEKAHRRISPGTMERPPSPEKLPRMRSPEKVRRKPSPEKGGHPSPGIESIFSVARKHLSPQRQPPSPEMTRYSSAEMPETEEFMQKSKQPNQDALLNLRSRVHPTIDTKDLTPAYSFDKDDQGRKKLGRSPRLESVLARMELRKQERHSRLREPSESPTLDETLEEYDAILDQLMRQNKTLKRGGRPSETSLGSDSEVIKRRIIDLREKKITAMKLVSRNTSTERDIFGIPRRFSGDEDAAPLRDVPHTDARSVSSTSSVPRLKSTLHYRPERPSASPHTPMSVNKPPRPEDAIFSASPIRSRSVPNSREKYKEINRFSETTSRLLSASKMKKSRLDASPSSALRVETPHEPVFSPRSVEAPYEKKYQRIAQEMFQPRSSRTASDGTHHCSNLTYSVRHSNPSSGPELQTRIAMPSQSSRPEGGRDMTVTLKPAATALSGASPHPGWESKTPYMDRFLAESKRRSLNYHHVEEIQERDARDPVPAWHETLRWSQQHNAHAHDDELRQKYHHHESSITKADQKKKERQPQQQNQLHQYSPYRRDRAAHGTETFSERSISSPERRRLLGNSISDQTSQLKRDLDLARLSSHKIRKTNVVLSSEIAAFKEKLSQHTRSKQGERAILGACQWELGELQQRLHETRRQGLEARNDSFMSDMTMETAWEDFSEIRGAMLHNLRLMHDAQERLMKQRYRSHEHDKEDEDRLMDLQNRMAYIERQEKYDSNMVRIALEEADRIM